jgi:hypothetical protein
MEFPAVWIANEGSFGVTDKPLAQGSFVAFQNGFFDGLCFFDSSGTEWVVERAVPRSTPGIFDRVLNRRLQVELHFAPPRQTSVSEFAERLCSCIDRDPDDLYDQFVPHQQLKTMFRAATTPAELIELARTLGEDVTSSEREAEE